MRIIREYVRHRVKSQWDFVLPWGDVLHSKEETCFSKIVRFVMIIQVYEIQTPNEAEEVIAMGVDHVGSVILDRNDWKHPMLKDTIRTIAELGSCSSIIPLFTDFDIIQKALDYYQPDIVHFCNMLPDRIRQAVMLDRVWCLQQSIREHFPQIRVMRSLPIPSGDHSDGGDALAYARRFEPISDFFLTDTFMVAEVTQPSVSKAKTQPVNGFIGITGKTCNWQIAKELVAASGIPVILAGGITPDNVAEGIQQVRPAGVDSCTGTNACDHHGRPIRFQKDMNRVKHLVAAARQAAIT